jgi:transposase
MKLEDILSEWDKDSQLDRTKLDHIALDLPKLHAKYIRILSHERMVLTKYEAEYKQLKFDKYDFYVDGPSEDTPKEWIQDSPARGRIIKTEVGRYLEADKDIIALSLKIGLQKEKIDTLKSIVDIISRMGYQIRTAVDWQRFLNGS